MAIFYVIIALLILLFISLLKGIREGTSFSKAITTFLLICFVIITSFIIDNQKNNHIAKAVETFKNWIYSPDQSTQLFTNEPHDDAIIKIKDKVSIDAPVIKQFPELPRGCEVTSLAMLLQNAGTDVDKVTLAKEVNKDPTPYKVSKDKIHFGNPNNGFVGDMFSYDNPGLGVYHAPIKKLAEKYLPNRILDLTGKNFQELKIHLSDHRPIWVIINTTYKRLPDEFFEIWHTPSGTIKVTTKEHSVLLTGYDDDFIYFNDPLTGEKNKKAPIKDFKESWVQMGSQAITYLSR